MKLTEQQRTIVKRARDRIADPANWCRGALAFRADDRPCNPEDSGAVKFCAVGALAAYYAMYGSRSPLADARKLALQLAPHRALANINDDEGHAAVLAIFDWALA